ncbi:MAG TPA: polyprenol monophosphomannose synthase [Nanoarchaeota archaeon]|nr:polyprenol monophosphomannose synthase [Nanoarchaeota archaeon]
MIILPTYNEKENISALITEIFKVAKTDGLSLNIVVVDDNSPDGTGRVVDRLAKGSYKNKLFIIKRAGKLGLGTAYIAGFKFALKKQYDYAITMDADFSHNPRYLPAMLAKMQECDICIGSRYVPHGGTKNWGLSRKIISRGANTLAHLMLGLQARDCTAGFRCYKRGVLESLNLNAIHSNGFSFLMEMLYKCQEKGFKVGEVPIIFEDRRVGISKISRKEVAKALITLSRFTLYRLFGGKHEN